MKMGGLVEDWRQAWKWFSVQGAAILAIAPELYEQAHGMQEWVEPNLFHHGMAALGALVLLSRVVKQGEKFDPDATDTAAKK